MYRYFCAPIGMGESERALRILAYRYPFMIWMGCWANKLNFMIKTLLEQVRSFRETCELAHAATKNVLSFKSDWGSKLQEVCDMYYGKEATTKLFALLESDWNSTQACFASQLRIEDACKEFAESNIDSLPAVFKIWSDTNYWRSLKIAEQLIRPFCQISQWMMMVTQSDSNLSMAHVMLIVLTLFKNVSEYMNSDQDAAALLEEMEELWKHEEHPLYLLAFVLHPTYRATGVSLLELSEAKHGNWTRKQNYFSVARLMQAAEFYYGKFKLYKSEPDSTNRTEEVDGLESNIKKWMMGVKLNINAFRPGEDPVEWWKLQTSEYPEIASLAMFLLDCPATATSCDRVLLDPQRRLSMKLNPSTSSHIRHVQHDLRRKFPGARHPIVSSAQYPHMITVVKNEEVLDNSDGHLDKYAANRNEVANSNDAMDAAIEEKKEGPVSKWIQALSTLELDGDSRENRKMYSASDAPAMPGVGLQAEDSLKKENKILPPLPEENDPNWPEDNESYFSSVKSAGFIRSDKYTLSMLFGLCKSLPEDLPSIDYASEKKLSKLPRL